ncbi:1-acyl-sn-glycerol-3-phosphate acyltransferase [Rhizobium sp. BK251]|uniref:lysophospholipid acyltransferase family protein n=1 Tax=Rhizobium sp. BK251 TaxID=2512125 RepID=UPI001047BC29|nr:1-acyl-sn-glycerol-3-phosphate acyltransferase [Rhizobium sp. BK251]TCL72678.1 1-acyl-sn-glycerol-3-phosphate acyltransferase [Rhizobium sp. BK251]
MIVLRSILFNALFYANLILRMIILSPVYFLSPRKKAYSVPKNWALSNHWLMEKIVGTSFEIEGLENIPAGSYIVAPKHQSFWDTYALLPWLDDPVYILKRELMWIPLFGWYAMKQRMIPVNRGARGKVMVEVLARTRAELATGRQLIIYPEGTRRAPGAEPLYKYGIARMYRDLGIPVVPVAMHPGLFWPRRKFGRYPGHFKVRILPPIEPGMDPDAFFARLIEVTEKASDELLVDTAERNPNLPLPPTAARRLAELGAASKAAQA